MKTLKMVSRFTWQAPQTILGNTIANFNNSFGNVSQVRHIYGVTVLKQENDNLMGNNDGMTLSNYIIGGSSIEASPYNSLFQHEYGHYEQSRHMGPMYLYVVGIPSFLNATFGDYHKFKSYERDANYRAFVYFNKYVPGFYTSPVDFQSHNSHWNFDENLLTRTSGEYVDFKDKKSMDGAYNSLSSLYHSFVF